MTYRIVSQFKDYYDYMQKWGFDPNKTWIRKNEVVSLQREDIPLFPGVSTSTFSSYYNRVGNIRLPGHYYDNVTQFRIGVAGYWTRGLKIRTKRALWQTRDTITILYPGWDEMSEDYISEHIVDFRKASPYIADKASIIKAVNRKRITYDIALFKKYKTPILLIESIADQGAKHEDRLHHDQISLDNVALQLAPNLSDYNYSIVDPDVIKLWGDITQFMDNTLKTVDCPVQIGDDDLRDGKGFDNKSFKNTDNRLKL